MSEMSEEVVGRIEELVRKGVEGKLMEDKGKGEKKAAGEELLALMSMCGTSKYVVDGCGAASSRGAERRNVVEGKLREVLLLKGMSIVEIEEVVEACVSVSKSEFVVFSPEKSK